jgi:RNA polymerase sigma-70 factor (ECF subfamily)
MSYDDDDEGLARLIAGVRSRDPKMLAAYIERVRAPLLAYVEKQLSASMRRKIEAEDVLQEASAEAVRSLPSLDLGDREPFAWLCQLCEWRIVDAHRRFFGAQKRDAAREVSFDAPGGSSRSSGFINILVASMTTASQAFDRNAKESMLQKAMLDLNDDQREALRLRYVEGLPSKEIADRMGKTDGAIRVMLVRSVRKLQELLGEDVS